MPNVVGKMPQIIKNLNKMGKTIAANSEDIKIEVMRETGIINAKTLINAMEAMVKLGFIKDSGHGSVFYLCQFKPYNFPQDKNNLSLEKDELTGKDEFDDKYGL